MKKYLYICAVNLIVLTLAAQEFQLGFEPAYTSYVSGEPVVVKMELLNTGRELVQVAPGAGSDLLMVEVSLNDRYSNLPLLTTAPFCKSFTLKPGRKFSTKIELDKWFSLLKNGKYFAKLIFVHGGNRYESVKKSFDVVSGMPVKEGVQMFVSDDKLKRVFKLVHWPRSRSERLFLRIKDEPTGSVWDTIDLGQFLKTSDPKLDIASNGEVTVVHRATQDVFFWTVLWSLPRTLEIAERNQLLDPEVSASQRVRTLYGDTVEDGPVNPEAKPWWKFW